MYTCLLWYYSVTSALVLDRRLMCYSFWHFSKRVQSIRRLGVGDMNFLPLQSTANSFLVCAIFFILLSICSFSRVLFCVEWCLANDSAGSKLSHLVIHRNFIGQWVICMNDNSPIPAAQLCCWRPEVQIFASNFRFEIILRINFCWICQDF